MYEMSCELLCCYYNVTKVESDMTLYGNSTSQHFKERFLYMKEIMSQQIANEIRVIKIIFFYHQ